MDREDNFVLVEALSRWHCESSHLLGAVRLPYKFVDEAEKVLPDKHAEIVMVALTALCGSPTVRQQASLGSEQTNEPDFSPSRRRCWLLEPWEGLPTLPSCVG